MKKLFYVSFLILWVVRPSLGFEVYLDTNHDAGGPANQLYDLSKWPETADRLNGIWFLGQGMDKPPAGINANTARIDFLRHFGRKQFTVELYHNFEKGGGPAYEIGVMKASGINSYVTMVYREDRIDSTLNPEDVASTRKAFKRFDMVDHPIIVNIRAFGRNKVLPGLLSNNLIDGYSLEWAGYYKDSFIKSDIVPALRTAVAEKKLFFMLCNAGNGPDYLADVQRIFACLREQCGSELNSRNVKFVVANYNRDTKIEFTPEKTPDGKYANTETGAALWLMDEADKLSLRNLPGLDPTLLVGTWKAPIPSTQRTETVTFAPDQSFEMEITDQSAAKASTSTAPKTSQSGTWHIQSNFIIEKLAACVPPVVGSKELRLFVSNLSDTQLVLRRGSQTLTFQRAPHTPAAVSPEPQ